MYSTLAAGGGGRPVDLLVSTTTGFSPYRHPLEGQNLLERMPPNDERVHGRHECPVPVVFPIRQLSVGRQPVEISILPSDIAVQTCRDEHGRPHIHLRLSYRLTLLLDGSPRDMLRLSHRVPAVRPTVRRR